MHDAPTQSLTDEQRALEQCLKAMQSHHLVQEAVCDALESVADSLPHSLDRQFCLELARSLLPIVKSAQDIEEGSLFPLLLRLDPCNQSLACILERLTFEHWEDESYALDVTDVLLECGQTGCAADAERAGFVIRGFFSSVRRHIAFEKDHVIPLAKRYLAPELSETVH